MDYYKPPSQSIWQGRKDTAQAERMFEWVQCLHIKEAAKKNKEIVICGFKSDEGVRRNQGRMGAKEGPDAIRSQLAKLPAHNQRTYLDVGNIVCDHQDLEGAQKAFAELINQCHQNNHFTIAFGGGHEIAWGHFQGLAKHYPSIGIINFDAHFDLRPTLEDGKGSSGTPFFQIAQHCKSHQQAFSYCCVGIQPQGNTTSLFEQAKKLDVTYLSAESVQCQPMVENIHFLNHFIVKHEHIYLSLCMDVFSQSEAPGVSAPQPLGITSWHTLPLLKNIIKTGKVVSLDIAELSPPLDDHEKTAKLAATLIAQILETL